MSGLRLFHKYCKNNKFELLISEAGQFYLLKQLNILVKITVLCTVVPTNIFLLF